MERAEAGACWGSAGVKRGGGPFFLEAVTPFREGKALCMHPEGLPGVPWVNFAFPNRLRDSVPLPRPLVIHRRMMSWAGWGWGGEFQRYLKDRSSLSEAAMKTLSTWPSSMSTASQQSHRKYHFHPAARSLTTSRRTNLEATPIRGSRGAWWEWAHFPLPRAAPRLAWGRRAAGAVAPQGETEVGS